MNTHSLAAAAAAAVAADADADGVRSWGHHERYVSGLD